MSLDVSDAFRTALYAESTGDVLAALLTFELTQPDNTVDTERITNHPGGITSNGNVFRHHPVAMKLPSSKPGESPKARLQIDYVDRSLGLRIRSSIASRVTIQLVLVSEPDDVEIAWTNVEIGGSPWDVQRMTLDLVRKDGKREPYPVPAFTPTVSPGAH